jgi:TRAP-type C4-dicarboxylate transport system permease large subunit
MLLYRLDWLCNGILVLMALTLVWAVIAYHDNSRRSEDDPSKKNYHPLAVFLAPITFPIIIILSVSFFILRVLTYGVFLALFILALIFMPTRSAAHMGLRRTTTSIADRLLEINTLLVRFFLKPWIDESEKI